MSHIDHIEDVYSKRPISTDMYFNPSNEHEDNIDNMQIQPDDDDNAPWLPNDNYNEQYSDDSFNVIKLEDENEILKDKIIKLEYENEILKGKIQETNDNFDQFKILYNELDNNYNILINENNKYQNEIKLYEQNIDDLQKKYEDLKNKTSKEHKEHQMIIKKFNDAKETEGQQLQIKIDSQEQRIDQLQQSLELKDNEIQNLKNENEILKDKIQETNDNFDQFKILYNELDNNYNILINENNKYQNKIKLYEQNIDDLRKKYEDLKNKTSKEHKEHQMIIKKFNDIKETEGQQLQIKIDSQEQRIDKLQQYLELKNNEIQNLKNENEKLNNKIENLNIKNENLENQLKDLFQQNLLLKEEAQCAIITATNFSLNDDYQKLNIKLNKDILSLQNTLDNYVTNLKSNIDININEVKELLLKYGCQTVISNKKPNKSLIRAVLQRHVLEEILKQSDFYFTCSSKEHHLESNIISQTTLLTNLMKKFHNERLGDNDLTNLMLIRLRQHVYNALSIRGFNNIKQSDGENSKHNFVDMISKKINEVINKYRIIKDIEENNYVNEMAEDLVRNVIKTFYFHLFIQEPIAQYRWIKNNEKFNKSYMKGSWDEDNVKNMVVEICSFPLIFKTSDSDDFKVFTPAKVLLRQENSMNAENNDDDNVSIFEQTKQTLLNVMGRDGNSGSSGSKLSQFMQQMKLK
ncbi:hypothetical protein RhiirA1_520295 [Rhizophagus irregularis]|uniref:Uncharacterized protein n=1 Tax=Rhizophagus irregularis TaxID=588596 RepID=A0A2N0RIC8_9GLOM|nr:hypothetical protein RhiirA1_520295 [Rhizophagus irregularis]